MNRGSARLACAVMVVTASVLAAGASAETVAPSPIATLSVAELAEGERLFQRHCGRCHGMRGAGGEGPSLNRPTLEHARDDQALFEVISEGIPGTGMPNTWAPNDRELWQIAGYVRTLGRLPSEPLPGDPAAGRTLYETTGNCGSCHIVRGSGRGVGPELTSVGLRRNAEYLRRALTDPDADSPMLTSQLTGRIDAFLTVRVVAADGEYEGLRVSEDEFSVQLRDLAGTVRSFDKGGLLDFEKAFGHSLMPGYGTVLRPEEVNDLVAYLMTLKGVP